MFIRLFLSLLFFFFLSACGIRIDFAQRQMSYASPSSDSSQENDKETESPKEDTGKDSSNETSNNGNSDKEEEVENIVRPDDSTDIDESNNNIEDTSEGKGDNGNDGNTQGGNFPLIQRQTIRLKDGRTIVINNADIVHDSEKLQIRKTGDLTYTGLHPHNSQVAQTGLLKDEANNTIVPVVILGHGKKTSDIPEGGRWEGEYYGRFQGENHSYDVYGFANAEINLSSQTILGQVEHLTTTPSLTAIPAQPTEGSITFSGNINNGEWEGTASSQGLVHPETNQPFKESSGTTQGVFITPSEGPATEAAGHITLKDANNKGLVGTINMQNLPD